jgi:type VI secretion system protein VasD
MTGRRQFLLPRLMALACASLLSGCGPEPKPPAILTLTITGAADQNPSTSSAASSVAVRIYQLTATAKFERGDWPGLTEREQQTLGADSAGSQEFVITPGQRRDVTLELKPMVQWLGAVVLYRDIDNAQWRASAPVATSGPTRLTLNIGKLAIKLQPTP